MAPLLTHELTGWRINFETKSESLIVRVDSSFPTSITLIRRNDQHRQQQLVGNLSLGISRWNCINLSSRTCSKRSPFSPIVPGQSPVDEAPGSAPCSPLLPYHFAPPETSQLGAGAANAAEPYGRLYSATPETRVANRMAATFMPLSTFRSASPVSPLFIFRLLNYIAINNACPPTALFTIPSTPREESSSLFVADESPHTIWFQ